ncbi:MAG: 30S ribosomal protein THX [Flavobacteriia bacterium]|jgi:ribosomal small subunit protein bTHX
MGRGDKKTAKGKRTIGSYGVTRKRKSTAAASPAKAEKKVKVVAEKTETVKKAAPKKEVKEKTDAPKKAAPKKAAKKED